MNKKAIRVSTRTGISTASVDRNQMSFKFLIAHCSSDRARGSASW